MTLRSAVPQLLLIFACGEVHGQPSGKPEFEVVSVKPSASPNGGRMTVGCHGGPGTVDPVLLVCQNLDLANLVGIAYLLDYFQLSAPDWMNDARFDIRAKIPEGTTKDQVASMWQNMLADRFNLRVHRETREAQTYELVVAKGGPKFKQAAEPDGNGGLPNETPLKRDKDGYPSFGPGHPGMSVGRGQARMYYPRLTMQRLADHISGQLGAPVDDGTNLKGNYEVGLY